MLLDGAITYEALGTAVAVVGIVFAAWWRIDARVKETSAEIARSVGVLSGQVSLLQANLAEFKVEVAQTYASKGGMAEMGERIMTSQRQTFEEVRHLRDRVDRLIDGDPTKHRGGQQ